MAIVRLTNCKELALKNFIHKWMEDPELYCTGCGWKYISPPEGCEPIICCSQMQICTNIVSIWAVIKQNKMLKDTRLNDFASNKDKNFRMAMSLPSKLVFDLEGFCATELKEELWHTPEEQHDFMRAFPQFCIPERI